MAYMNQEMKAKLAPAIKAVMKKYGIKGSIAVRNHSTLVLNIKSGKIDFVKNYASNTDYTPISYIQVNVYHINRYFNDVAAKFLNEVYDAMMQGNWDNSQIEVDYFDKGWYTDINIGQWNKPYTLDSCA